MVGANVATAEGARLVRRTVAEGHLLGNHAMTYADLGAWAPERVEADLRRVNLLIGEALADPTPPVPYFRAPNGSWGRSSEVAVSLGMQPLGVVNTIDDWRTQHVPTLVANLRLAIRPGELFVVHDGGGDRQGRCEALRHRAPPVAGEPAGASPGRHTRISTAGATPGTSRPPTGAVAGQGPS